MTCFENRIIFKIKSGYHLELLMPETVKLLESNKGKTKDENGENVHHSKINKVILFRSIIFNNDYQQNPRAL